MSRYWKQGVALAALTAAVGLWCLSPVMAKPPGGGSDGAAYAIIPFMPPGAASVSSSVHGINEQGHAVGAVGLANGVSQAIHLDIATGVYTSLQGGIVAEGVNNSNQIVGKTEVADFASALFWSSPSADPVPLLPLAGDVISEAFGVNDAGIVVGYSYDGVSKTPDGAYLLRGVVWRVVVDADAIVHVDGPVELPPLYAGAAETRACAVNEIVNGTAQIVGNSGYQAVVWTIELNAGGALVAPAAPVPVGTLGASWSEGGGINDSADVCGRSDTASSVYFGVPFVALAGQEVQPLPVPRGTVFGIATDINNEGEIVGQLRVPYKGFGEREYAYLWKDGKSIDLNKQITAQSGWELRYAEVISNGGIIGGYGRFDVYLRGFLLIPNP